MRRLFQIISLIIFFVIIQNKSFAGSENYPVGARSAGMANSTVMTYDVWSVFHNQAGLAFIKNIYAGSYFENRFNISELGVKSFAFVLPTKTGNFGASVTHFGYSKYNESKFGLAYARMLGEKFSVGLQFDYLNTFVGEEYGNKGTVVFELGLMAEPIKNLIIGAHVYNPTRSKFAAYQDERIPTIFRLGLGYKFSDKVLLTIETDKELDYKPTYKTGVEYHFLKNFYLRTGISANPNQNFFGMGYVFKRFSFDIAFSTHEVLPMTSHFSINYKFN
ncbi:MAG: hypothetical protein IMY72_12085 [Bacteroidetes bacterium]|nr:hypothetical protein [Bacteroidota bacterium]